MKLIISLLFFIFCHFSIAQNKEELLVKKCFENYKQAILADQGENAIKFVNTSDFTTENLKYGKKVDPNEYNPEALQDRLKFKQRVLAEKVAENKRKASDRSPEEKKASREEVDKLRKDIKELKDTIANPPTPVQKDQAKNDGNAIRQAAKVTAKKRLKPR